MSKIKRIAVLAMSVMSLFGVMSSSAGATTWTNTGDTAFTATSGGGTLSVTATNLSCTGGDATGTASTHSVLAVWSAIAGTAQFTGCRLAGINSSMDCAYVLTASSQGSGVTAGTTDVNCGVYQGGTNVCTVTGGTPGDYVSPAGGFGSFILTASASLVVGNGSGGTCPLRAGELAVLTAFTFRLTAATGGASAPHFGPIISRS